ncbi:fumarate reductase (CoM/CoB) subunit TfrB [Methanobacterium petrolearium]|uniref:fumarate reductase (CoM/CoB) subunit TfrB n=1 Tax=Methanobacterium petrolearium TaxID=710190 RepID=UPI001AE8E6FA|nr:fumarate reductase (CoM/CoB) subunit TfrB [Methanobacterium petrolearium]MBP1945671.1 fumarate reductase (CoM/CoB) subunit B [Methanobacterium petrolearium]BDZ71911.1 succinate dehydrogenase [Methanobacterium petrolearium]
MIDITVKRYQPPQDEEPHFETYSVEEKEKMKVLDALNYINQHHHVNIAYRSSCRAGQCGSCALKVNGELALACKKEIKDGDVIEPLDLPVIKDLVVDRSEIDGKVGQMGLFLEDECEIVECPAIIDPAELENTKKLRSCIDCYSCLSACPVLTVNDEFAGPYFMRYFSKFAMDPRDCADRAEKGFDEGLYCCTSCAKCVEVCPKEINTFGGAIEKLREMACQEGVGPLPAHKSVKELVEKTGRSVEPMKEGPMRDGFIKTVAKKRAEEDGDNGRKREKVALFTGCLMDYRLPEIGMSLIDVLNKHEVDVEVPAGQVCCGSPLIRTGQTDILSELVRKNANALESYDTIITVCAGCGATLKRDYLEYGVKLNVMDISEYLVDKLNTNDMKPVNMRVTYHDPCHLIRGQGISEQPREILKNIKGVDFVEMEVPDQCCGAGGGVRSGKPEIAAALGSKKAKMVEKLDVDAVITICPFCENNIRASLEAEGLDMEVMNILTLLEKSYNSHE